MSNFWIGFVVGGFICGLIGFLSAAILAASGRASRMEEEIEEEIITMKSKDMPAYREIDEKKDTYGVVTKNNPRTD